MQRHARLGDGGDRFDHDQSEKLELRAGESLAPGTERAQQY